MENENELELNLDELDQIDTNAERKLEVKNRYQKLSEKVKTTAQEKEAAEAARKAAEEARTLAEKERDFFKNFSQVSSRYPNAAQFQDLILEKVNKGYDMEDAAIAVLSKEGKLGSEPQPTPQPESPAGGSAATVIKGDAADKPLDEMSVAEKRSALEELEKKGEISKIFNL